MRDGLERHEKLMSIGKYSLRASDMPIEKSGEIVGAIYDDVFRALGFDKPSSVSAVAGKKRASPELNFDSSDEEEKEEEGNNDVMITTPTAGHSAGTNGVPIDRVPEGLIDLPADVPVDRPADGPAEQFADGPPPMDLLDNPIKNLIHQLLGMPPNELLDPSM